MIANVADLGVPVVVRHGYRDISRMSTMHLFPSSLRMTFDATVYASARGTDGC